MQCFLQPWCLIPPPRCLGPAWKSLCSPACLPLTSKTEPPAAKAGDVPATYVIRPDDVDAALKTMIQLRLMLGFQIVDEAAAAAGHSLATEAEGEGEGGETGNTALVSEAAPTSEP